MAETRPAPDLEFQALVREKYAGNPQAMAALGARLIVGRDAPRSLVDGVALISEAAQRGDAAAWCRLAMLSAAGVGRTRSWDDAFSALHHATELGDAHAARQIEVLNGCSVAGAADAERWLAPAGARILHESPRFATYSGFLTPALCTYLMELSAARLVQAQVYDAYRGGLKIDAMRTNTGAAYSLIDTDVVMQLVRARIARAAGLGFDALEPTEVLHYSAGERYKPHFDFFHPSLPNYAEEMRVKGQRIKTCLVYLNDGYEGGETEFPRLGIKFRGKPGEALIFNNVLADGAGDPDTLHAGLPPTSGEKWLLSQWMRDKQPQPVV
jgi:prolyl 4-hydroxylase